MSEIDAEKKREHELKKIVLAWLNKKGYRRAADVVDKDARADVLEGLEDLAFRRGLETDMCVSNYILQWGMEDAKAIRYEESYTELKDWIARLPEEHKNELTQLLYPVFVHLYLELVSKQCMTEARDLLQHFRVEHEPEYTDEITSLALIMDPEKMFSNPVARRYLGIEKTEVMLCHETDKMLTEVLHNKRLHIIIRLINQYVNIVIYGATVHDVAPAIRAPKSLVAMGNRLSAAHSSSKASTSKRTRAMWAEFPDESPKQVKQAIVVKAEPGTSPATQVSTQNAEKSEEIELENLSELRRRILVGKGVQPSVCCYTVDNSQDALHCLDLSTDASLMAGGLSDSRIKLWKTSPPSDPEIVSTSKTPQLQGEKEVPLVAHAGAVYATSISPDSRFVLSSSEDCTVRLWSVEERSNLVTYRGHNFPVWDTAFSLLGHYFATASHDKTARLWSTDHIHPVRIFAGHLESVDTVCFHPNSNYIATGSTDKTCRLWDCITGDCMRLFKGHGAPVTSTTISSCGKMLASGADNGEVVVWDIGSSKPIWTLPGHVGAVNSLSFSPKGSSLLASGGQDGTVRLWELPQGPGSEKTKVDKELKVLTTKLSSVLLVKFSRSNLLITAGGGSGDT